LSHTKQGTNAGAREIGYRNRSTPRARFERAALQHLDRIYSAAFRMTGYLTYVEALRPAAVSFDKDLDKLSCCV
jgi:hypothetical protein